MLSPGTVIEGQKGTVNVTGMDCPEIAMVENWSSPAAQGFFFLFEM